MAHLLTPAPTTAATAFSTRPQKKSSLFSWNNERFHTPSPRVCCLSNQYQHQVSKSNQDQVPPTHDDHSLRRRALLGLSGSVVLGLTWSGDQSASGAGRPPPPPPREKKDPNVSGVQAKVIASKRRKEAMKELVAKLRDQGKKTISTNVEPPPPAPAPAPPTTPE